MAEFEPAVEYVLENEGGFVDNPNDAGGATNYGLSLRYLRSFKFDIDDIKNLTVDKAKEIYKSNFWDGSPFESIKYQILANYIFDMGVQHGIAQAIKLVQRSLWAVYRFSYIRECLKDDGVMGSKTLDLLNKIDCTSTLPVIVAVRASYCRFLAEENPKNKEFLNGWLERCYRI